jgi:hypothetical protein
MSVECPISSNFRTCDFIDIQSGCVSGNKCIVFSVVFLIGYRRLRSQTAFWGVEVKNIDLVGRIYR